MNSHRGDTDTVLDTVRVQFSVKIFCKQLLLHLLQPFMNWTTNAAVQNLSILPRSLKYWDMLFFRYGTLSSICSYLLIISYCVKDGARRGNLKGAIWFPLLSYLLHRIFISLKYASLSETEYNKIMNAPTVEKGIFYLNQVQFAGEALWKNRRIAEFELTAAAKRIGIDLCGMTFIIPKNDLNLEFLDKNGDVKLMENVDGTYHAKAVDVGLNLVVFTTSNSEDVFRPIFEKMTYAVSTAIVCIPFLVMFCRGNRPHINIWDGIFYATSTYLNVHFIPIVLFFLRVASNDITRERYILEALSSLIALKDSDEAEIDFRLGNIQDIARFVEIKTKLTGFASLSLKTLIGKHKDGALQPGASSDVNSPQPVVVKSTKDQSKSGQLGRNFGMKRGFNSSGQEAGSNDADYSVVDVVDSGALKDPCDKIETKVEDSDSQKEFHEDSKVVKVRLSLRDDVSTVRQLSIRIDKSESARKSEEMSKLPRLSFEHPQNIVAWSYMRLMYQQYGLRMRFRLTIFVGCIILCLTAVLGVAVSIVISSPTIASFYNVLLLQSMSFSKIILLNLLWYVYEASCANDALTNHTDLLASHILHNQRQLAEVLAMKQRLVERALVTTVSLTGPKLRLARQHERVDSAKKIWGAPVSMRPDDDAVDSDDDDDVDDGHNEWGDKILQNSQQDDEVDDACLLLLTRKVEHLKELGGCLEACLRTIEIANGAHPFTILGFPAQIGVISSIVSVALSFYTYILSVYLHALQATIPGVS